MKDSPRFGLLWIIRTPQNTPRFNLITVERTTSLTQGSSSGGYRNTQKMWDLGLEGSTNASMHTHMYTLRWPWRWAPPYPGPLAELLCAPAGCWAPPAAGGAWSAVGSAPRAAQGQHKASGFSPHIWKRFLHLTCDWVKIKHSAPARSSGISKPTLPLWSLSVRFPLRVIN